MIVPENSPIRADLQVAFYLTLYYPLNMYLGFFCVFFLVALCIMKINDSCN